MTPNLTVLIVHLLPVIQMQIVARL